MKKLIKYSVKETIFLLEDVEDRFFRLDLYLEKN